MPKGLNEKAHFLQGEFIKKLQGNTPLDIIIKGCLKK